jgi:hypothetical protein
MFMWFMCCDKIFDVNIKVRVNCPCTHTEGKWEDMRCSSTYS